MTTEPGSAVEMRLIFSFTERDKRQRPDLLLKFALFSVPSKEITPEPGSDSEILLIFSSTERDHAGTRICCRNEGQHTQAEEGQHSCFLIYRIRVQKDNIVNSFFLI